MSIALLGDRQSQFFQADYKPKIQFWGIRKLPEVKKKKSKYVIVVSQFKNKLPDVR